MNLSSWNFFKLITSLLLILLSFYFTINGFIELNKNQLKVQIERNNTAANNKITLIEINKNNKISDDRYLLESKNFKNDLESNKNLYEQLIIVKKNDTFSKIIDPFFSDKNIKNSLINEIQKKINLKNLNINQKIFFYLNEKKIVKKIKIPIDFTTDIIANIDSNIINISREKITIIKEIHSKEFKIESSLYEDGIKAGVPIKILTDSIRLYSFDIDFQRDIQKNTKFEVSYEKLLNEKRGNISYGEIVYVKLKIKTNILEYFQFKTDEGFLDYFDRKGKNVKKSILKTPIDGARLSSTYGMRKHPILGYNKLHKGVDFAAPKGTPVFAGGNGIIEYASTNGGYGKYIRIRHNNEYKTAYAHLSSFKKGISKGKRVNQGEIIAYVGSTGNSTGPHLHYEILYQNKQINPLKMKLPSGKILTGNELEKFTKIANEIYTKHLFVLYE